MTVIRFSDDTRCRARYVRMFDRRVVVTDATHLTYWLGEIPCPRCGQLVEARMSLGAYGRPVSAWHLDEHEVSRPETKTSQSPENGGTP